MKAQELSHGAGDGKSIHVYRWLAERDPKALLLIAHGMGEHAGRYVRVAQSLCDAGYEVWAPDHRGHGKTASEDELGWFAPKDGLTVVMEDLYGLLQRMKAERPGLPVFLMGHSMGSFIAQGFISRYGDNLAGCVLSGTAGPMGPIRLLGLALARLGCLFYGQKRKTPFLDTLSFGAFNKPFAPVRTAFDWLSRDPAEVDKYVADPRCGFIATFGLFRDLLSGLGWMQSKRAMEAIPNSLPIYMFSGHRDPVGGMGASVKRLYELYKGMRKRVTRLCLYEDGRHESLNEINRDKVTMDLVNWLNETLIDRRS